VIKAIIFDFGNVICTVDKNLDEIILNKKTRGGEKRNVEKS